MSKTQITSLPISHIQPNPFQPRGKIKPEELTDLAQSIRTYGILEPLVIAQTPAGYQLIAGERRWRAAKEAGLTEVPVVVKKTTPKGMLEMALVENVQRTDLSPLERAKAFQQLTRDFGFNNSDIAERVSKSPAYVSNTIRLLTLPDALKDGLVGNLITEGHARALMGIENEKTMINCYKIVLRENASVRRAEDLARRFKKKSGQVQTTVLAARVVSEELDDWRNQLQSVFSGRTLVKMMRTNRQTKVTFVLRGSPTETQDDMDKLIALSKKK